MVLIKRTVLAAVLLIGSVVLGTAACSPEKKDAKTKSPTSGCTPDDLRCKGDRLLGAATAYCQGPIEHMAAHSVRWTEGTFEPRFRYFRWADKAAGAITMIGDKAEFQNGFGAYTPVTYECDLAADGKTVLDVRVHEGRLPT